MLRCCFDKRVSIGLGLVAAVLLIADPRTWWVALPVLAGLACPVSMLLAMRGMRRGTSAAAPRVPGGAQAADPGAVAGRAAEIARLRAEIGLLKTRAGEAAPARGDSPATARAGRGQAG